MRLVPELSECSITVAKHWGACIGLKMAFDMGYKHILLELDSRIVTQMYEGHRCSILVKDICLIMAQDWTVQIRHVYCERNSCADLLWPCS